MNFHPAAQPTLKRVEQFYSNLFRHDLVGIYIHGSLVSRCYNPKLSDIDFIVVIQHPFTSAVKRKVIDFSASIAERAPGKGIECSVVTIDQVRKFTYPTPNELTFSNHSLDHHTLDELYLLPQESDPDLAAHFSVILDRGVVLNGLPIKDVFAPVPREYYLQALTSDVAYIKTMIHRKPFYGILNLCRIYAYKRDGHIFSKKEGGEWALKRLDRKYHSLISKALADYKSEMTSDWHLPHLFEFYDYLYPLIIR